MRNRILEIAEHPARLRVERHQLIIDTGGALAKVPIEDLAVLVVSHPQVSYTQAVLNELIAAGGAFLTCDDRRMPSGLLLPMDGNVIQTERFQKQIALSQPRRKQLWRQLIRGKVRMQATLLQERLGTDHGLGLLVPVIRSGDPSNVEAQAARRYWGALFGSDFRRDRDAADHNRMLNYGYAVLRAATSRAVVAAGLHPTIGLHHHNKYNSFCLADDLMEPYRPIVDQGVAKLMDGLEAVPEMTQMVRADLLGALTEPVKVQGEARSLFDALSRTAASLVQCIAGESRELVLPEGFTDAES
ncbi:type II CRISPR-associated endonuclease Cas1 [Planctomicrobium piriforme]|uniref:CRISPR-associated endonuclease Cas1 n=1 Tax=Planctomicrobium piriforme TaxID=1576369 RepID=A0A1I3B949_9PLAN|nr:type II CRISPR-associated endonuclease Cas1 [Planctomicrobium piriforme]SFH58211.1 CRISP-associated protein Cas1 [Planctomicrobium piriforme]